MNASPICSHCFHAFAAIMVGLAIPLVPLFAALPG